MSTALGRVLYLDFLGALATVVVMIAAADLLAPHVSIASRVLRTTGAVLVLFVAFVWHTARSRAIRRGRVYAIVAFNLLWLLASVFMLTLGSPTALGRWIIALQALLVVPLVFLELQALFAANERNR
jgi:hypothetical protein